MTCNTQTIFSPEDYIAGYSQADLGDLWWQYTDRIPYTEHFGAYDDTTDPRGRRGSLEKSLSNQPLLSGDASDRVLFIGGAFGNLPTNVAGIFTINRTVILPEGTTKVFFPMFNANANNLTKADPFSGGLSNDELKTTAAFYMNPVDTNGTGTSALFAKVDEQKIQDLYGYRQTSQGENGFDSYPIAGGMTQEYFGYQPDVSYLANPELKGQGTVTPENPEGYPTLQELGGYNSPEEERLAVKTFADGYWLGVELNQGEHTLNFGGTFSNEQEPTFALDITYNVLNAVEGTPENDLLGGSQGNDYLSGDNGVDQLWGCDGDDLLVGGDEADILDGGKGTDELWGDNGSDTFIFRKCYGQDAIYDFTQGDKVDISGLCIHQGSISEIQLPGGLSTQIDFNGTDRLTLVGVTPDSLKINCGIITL